LLESQAGTNTTTPRTLTLPKEVNIISYFFFRDKMPIDMNMLVFFLGKCVRTAATTMVVDRQKPEGTSSAIFGVEIAAKCCELKRCAYRIRSRTDNKDEVLEGEFRNLNFSRSTKKTTECSFELLGIYIYHL